jgi:predicted regulator of Ras-like GTPase activity (Roadblock/LC7/MglB family)
VPFQYILANLLAETGASGILFLDELGETVDVACSDYTPYDMKILGAYFGIYMRQLTQFLTATGVGRPELIYVEKERVHIYSRVLPDDYYLVLVQKRPALVGKTRVALDKAAKQLRQEVF